MKHKKVQSVDINLADGTKKYALVESVQRGGKRYLSSDVYVVSACDFYYDHVVLSQLAI